ncbi:MAG: hypothetical protein O6952_03535, partial [Planctomycetota bacterium]|nr:hypothetical protein [Planctomycetota bacterium]
MAVKSNLDDLRDLVERFMGEMALARYRAGAGLGEEAAVDSVIQRHSSLMDPAILEMVAEASGSGEAGDGDELRRALVFLHLDEEARPSTERLLAEMRKARLRVSGEEIPFLESSRRIDAEGDRRLRALIARAREHKVAEWEPILQDRLARLDEKSREMGRKGYGALLEKESGFDLAALEGQIGEFLARTQDLYREVFSWLMKSRLQMEPADAEHHDLRRAFRGEEFDSLLSDGQLLTALSNFTRAIQIDLQAAGRIEFDLEDRPGKQSRPFFSRVRVPDQIILTAPPRGGHAH